MSGNNHQDNAAIYKVGQETVYPVRVCLFFQHNRAVKPFYHLREQISRLTADREPRTVLPSLQSVGHRVSLLDERNTSSRSMSMRTVAAAVTLV
ncbi:hypothetical protein ElyMa_005606700 [Elysia marginata]|uniref:Uncharacterized protein n=1 Tax=Elysia marginata TaxID=1093978 RepID=A0AAV4F4U1_9GAST|nr:hypothetical protein ElyMa_005606700 [Elysia marginata]